MMDTTAVKLFSLVVLVGCWQTSGQVVVIGFSNDVYEGSEENPNRPCRVTVDVNASTEILLQIQLTPSPGNATINDFNDTEIITTIMVPASTSRWEQEIQIYDDNINEAEEVFNVSLTVEGNFSVEYRTRTAVCRIPESDPIDIGFTVPRINHTEQFAQYDTIINKSLVSEQTFEIQIQIVTPTLRIGQRAIEGEDFIIGATNGVTVVFRRMTPAEQILHFAYRIIGDNTPENQEVFQLSITPVINTPSFGCNITSGCYQQIDIVIEDNDVVVVGFVETLIEVNETDGQATLNVSISSPQPDPVLRFEIMFSLNVDSANGSAGSDFALVRRQPPIPGVDDFPRIVNGFYYIFDEMAENRSQRFMVLNEMFNGTQRWQTFSFPIYVDDVPEGVEELNLTLSLVLDPTLPAGSVNVTPAVATVRIQDFSSVVVGFDTIIYTVSEGNGQVELCVNITVPRRQDIGTVTFNLTVETQNGSAVSNSDYMAVSMTLDTFTNQRPRQCFNVSITNDATSEETENFTARLMLVPGSVATISADRIVVDPPEARVQITDNDHAITVGYIQTAVNVSEGVQVIQLTVAISTPPDEIPIATFFLRVNTSNRTATAPVDYGALTNFRLGPFNNSVRQLSFNVTIVNDNITEVAEMFSVSLTLDPADQARIGNLVTVSPDVATVTIQDDDEVTVGYVQTVVTVLESNGVAQLTVGISMSPGADLIETSFFLLVNTADGTATAPVDYGALTNFRLGPFNNSVRQLSFNVTIVNDNITEVAEMFNISLTLDPADQARIGNLVTVSPDVATITIQDNDEVTVGYVQTFVTVSENDGVVQLTVGISMPPGADPIETSFFLLVNTSDGTATAPVDYGALTNFRLGPFNNSVRQLSFNVTIVNDNITEDAEMFNVRLTLDPADQARIGNLVTVSPDVATVTIQDNDEVTVGYVQRVVTVLESDGVAQLTVDISMPPEADPIETSFFLLVNTSDGTATAPVDYGALTNFRLGPFNNSVRQLSFNVTIVNDNITEGAEMFSVSLTLDPDDQARIGNLVTVSPDVAAITIQDNDEVTVGYVQTVVTVFESDGVAQLTVDISMPPEADPIETSFFLLLNTSDGTATAPVDYGALTNFRLGPFNNSVRQLSFNVTIVNDNITEDAEMFNVSLTLDPDDQARIGNLVTVSPDVATVTIQDDDVPTGPPLNLVAQSFNSTSLMLSWEPPSPVQHSGAIFNYTLTCISELGLPPLVAVYMTAGTYTLNGLTPATVYACSVFATNLYGDSPPANVSAMTEDGVPGPVTEVTFRRVSDSTIIVGWRMPEITNGLILRYNITVTLYSSGEVVYTNVIAAGGQLSDRVTGLAPFIPYRVAISAQNNNTGEVNTDIVFSREGNPTVAPRNVQATRLNGTHMNISWELPTLVEARGFINSTIITLIPSSESGRKKRQVMTVSVPGNITSAVIGGLNPELQYSVVVRTSTSEGAGPEATTVVPAPCVRIFQVLLGEVNDCTEWRFQNTAEKLADITSSVISAVNPRCRCSLTEDQISTEHFLCTNDERVVLYRAELSGRPDCAQVLSYIQQWVNGSQTSILVQGNSLVVYPNCPITVQSLTAQADCVRSTNPGPPDSGSIGIIAAGGGVGGALFIGIVVLAAVVTCMCIYRRRRQRSIDIRSNTYSEIPYHGKRRKLSESYQMSAVNPHIKPPLPRRTSTTSRPRVDDSYIVMNPVSVKKELSDGLYEEVGTKKETAYENMGECQLPKPSDYIEPKRSQTPDNT